jgi:hypothetical protein
MEPNVMLAKVRRVASLCLLGASLFILPAQAQEESSSSSSSSSSSETRMPVPPATTVLQSDAVYSTEDSVVPQGSNPWVAIYLNWSTLGLNKTGQSQVETYNYFDLGRRITNKSMLSVKPEFYVKGAGVDGDGTAVNGSAYLGDIIVQYAHAQIELMDEVLEMKPAFRMIYPSDPDSRLRDQITQAQVRLDFISKPLAGLKLNYHFRPSISAYGRQTYVEKGVVKTNEIAALEERLEIIKTIVDKVTFHQHLGIDWSRHFGSAADNIPAHTDAHLILQSTLMWEVLPNLSLESGLYYDSKLGVPGRSTQLYAAPDTKYVFSAFWTM